MKRLVVLLALALAMVTALTGCDGLQGTDGKEYVGSDFSALEIAPADRSTPIESTGTTVDGKPLDVASYRGKVLVVNVWWSGCGPCIKEMPMLSEVAAGLGDQAALIGINILDNSADNAASFQRGLGVTFPSIYAPGGTTLLDFTRGRVSPRSVPSTVVLDREGRIAALISGPIPTKQTLLDVVDKVLEEDGSSIAPSTGTTNG